MSKVKLTYYFSLLLILIFTSCGQYKSLKQNQVLLRKNKFEIKGDKFLGPELKTYIRQKPNKRILGIAFSLSLYNAIDSNKIIKTRQIQISKLRLKNIQLYEKQSRINKKRNEKAIKNGIQHVVSEDRLIQIKNRIVFAKEKLIKKAHK